LHHRSAEFGLLQIVDGVRAHLDPPSGTASPKGPDSVLLATTPTVQRSSDIQMGMASINGRHYSDSVIHRCADFASSPRGSVSYNLGMNYRLFEATAGVLDDAADANQTGVFQVVVDGTVREEVTVRQDTPAVLRVNVTDVLRLQMVSFGPGTTSSPILAGARMAGGLSNHLPELAWGNPTVHT
jgi:hypothetical protein